MEEEGNTDEIELPSEEEEEEEDGSNARIAICLLETYTCLLINSYEFCSVRRCGLSVNGWDWNIIKSIYYYF